MNIENQIENIKCDTSIFEMAMVGDIGQLSMKLLDEDYFDLEKKNKSGLSLLAIAVKNNQYEFSRSLLSSGANPNSQDNLGNTPLMRATLLGNLKLVKLLLQYGANENIKNDANMTAHDWALAFNRINIVSYLGRRDEAKRSRLQSIVRLLVLTGLALRKR